MGQCMSASPTNIAISDKQKKKKVEEEEEEEKKKNVLSVAVVKGSEGGGSAVEKQALVMNVVVVQDDSQEDDKLLPIQISTKTKPIQSVDAIDPLLKEVFDELMKIGKNQNKIAVLLKNPKTMEIIKKNLHLSPGRKEALQCLGKLTLTQEGRVECYADQELFNDIWGPASMEEDIDNRNTMYLIVSNVSNAKQCKLGMFSIVKDLMIRAKEETHVESKSQLYSALQNIADATESKPKLLYLVDELMKRASTEENDVCRAKLYRCVQKIAAYQPNRVKLLYLADELMIRLKTETFSQCLTEFYSILSKLSTEASNQPAMRKTEILDFLLRGAKEDDLFAHMGLANLVGSNEDLQHYLNDLGSGGLTKIIKVLYRILEPNHGEIGWVLSRPLQTLRNMALNESLREQMAPQIIPRLSDAFTLAFETSDDESMEYIFSLYSRFSKNPTYKEKFQNDPKVKEQIEIIRKNEHLRNFADGLAFDLFPDEERKIKARRRQKAAPVVVVAEEEVNARSMAPGTGDDSSPIQVMISYSWAQKPLATELKSHLQSLGLRVWQDIDSMKGNIMQSMAEAVDGSSVVFVLMSNAYYNSDNCQREATYATSERKKIIPILAESGYRWSGWLKIMLGTQLYYDITGPEFDRSTVAKIVQLEIKKIGNGVTNSDMVNVELPSFPPPSSSSTTSNVSKLPETVDDVYNWCVGNNGLEDMAQILKNEKVNGEALFDIYESGPEGVAYFFKDSKIEKRTVMKFYAQAKKLYKQKDQGF